MPLLNRNTGFLLGNVIGLTILIAGIVITAPQKQAEQREIDRRNSQPVVVAVCDIENGTRITADLIKEDRKPHQEVPLNAVESAKKIIGLLTTSAVKKGEVVKYSHLDLKSKPEQKAEEKKDENPEKIPEKK